MKSKNKIKFLLLFLIIFCQNLNAETIFFDSENIRIEEDGNMIFATKGKANIPSSNLIIEGNKFIYDKRISELIVIDDVEYFDKEKKIYIESQKIIYNEIDNTIFSNSDTYISNQDIYKIYSTNISYDRNFNKISSNEFTKIVEKNDNNFLFNKGLIFELTPEIISSKEVKVIDQNFNNYFFKN